MPIIFLCAIYPPRKTCYTLCTYPPTANWENLAVTSYQYRAVSACITDALHAFYMPDIRRFTMKMKSGNERKKIIRELLNRTDQEFTDEELIHQLIMTDRKAVLRPESIRRSSEICRKLGIYLQLYRCHGRMDGCQRYPWNEGL